MTPKEYLKCYEDFMANDDVFYVSEHRGAYPNSEELSDVVCEKPDMCLFPISITRFAAMEAYGTVTEKGNQGCCLSYRIHKANTC